MSNRRFTPSGEPWQIMYHNVINVMQRAVQLAKFPITCKEVIEPIIPAMDMTYAGIGREQWRNLMRCMHMSNIISFELHPTGSTFWVAADGEDAWPAPPGQVNSLLIDVTHPHYGALARWYDQADELDALLSESRVYLNRILKQLKHPQWVEKHWPGLVSYVGQIPAAMVKGMREPRPGGIHIDGPLSDKIENLLTAAVLLSEDYDHRAWVGDKPAGGQP